MYILTKTQALSRAIRYDLENSKISSFDKEMFLKEIENLKSYSIYIYECNKKREAIDIPMLCKYLLRLIPELKKKSRIFSRVNGFSFLEEEVDKTNIEYIKILKEMPIIEPEPLDPSEPLKILDTSDPDGGIREYKPKDDPEFNRDEIVTKAETNVSRKKISQVQKKFITILKLRNQN